MPKANKKDKKEKEEEKPGIRTIKFRNPNFSLKKGKNKPFKTFKQILQAENYEFYPPNIANYQSIEAGPSTCPTKKYCDISGHLAKYTDPKTGLRFCQAYEYNIIKYLSQEHIESYLALRKAVVVIR
ncbi:unnamed protein product [Blepharisma stoltei]|uniref:Vps72/YL1 C-terminal domain-containing protein n=1 Tax=Blepharisma stoltei TaxID=1481888 RepID=A0AAU9J8L5_9CILI|nr:unnamed protein product [Blepharisma stoltei]